MNLTTRTQRQKGHLAEGLGALLGIIVLVVTIGGLWFLRREKPDNVLDLLQSIEELPASSAKIVTLQLPRPGTLVVSLSLKRGTSFTVHLATADPRVKSDGVSEALGEFTAVEVTNYKHAARLEPGAYRLMLNNGSAPAGAAPGTKVRVVVRLNPR